MRKIVVILIFFVWTPNFYARAQVNQVKNPGLEKYWHCPNDWNEIKYANYWSSLGDTLPVAIDSYGTNWCSSEYCNACADYASLVAVPNGGYYNHYPHGGNGMAQVQMYYNFESTTSDSSTSYYRDYLQGRLYKRLIAGKQYCVSFFVVLEHLSAFSVNNIGAYLDDGTIDTATWCGWPQTTHTPQIVETAIISDTLNWTKVQGIFTASGSESFITIGNFTDSLHTLKEPTGSYWAAFYGNTQYSWYLVDDISVIAMDDSANAGPDQVMDAASPDSIWVGDTTGYLPCYWYANGVLIDSNTAGLKVHPDSTTTYTVKMDVCGKITYDSAVVWVWPLGTIEAPDREAMIRVYPVPAKQKITLSGAKGCRVRLCDMTGKTILILDTETNDQTIDISMLQQGIYLLEAEDRESGERVLRRVVKE